MKLFNKIAIIGIGLIGGSLAWAIKKRKLANEIIGVSRHSKSLLWARKNGLIDKGSQSLDVINDADLVILAAPVSTIMELSVKVSKIVKSRCLITDVGSTKKSITSVLEKRFPLFVGSHPLCGSEKRGVINASPLIFNGSLCILTPTRNTDLYALKKITLFWNKLGARTLYIDPDRHDKILALVSHMPHIAAFSLIDIVPQAVLKFAASGLKDTTRIASSDSRLWADIFLTNRKNILTSINLFAKKIAQIKSALKSNDQQALLRILNSASRKRNSLN